jgi:hypothetical protein
MQSVFSDMKNRKPFGKFLQWEDAVSKWGQAGCNLRRGILRVINSRCGLRSYITPIAGPWADGHGSASRDVLILKHGDFRGRSLHGDEVIIERLPETERLQLRREGFQVRTRMLFSVCFLIYDCIIIVTDINILYILL